MRSRDAERPLQLDFEGAPPLARRLLPLVRPALARALRLETLNDVHEALVRSPIDFDDPGAVAARILEILGVRWRLVASELDHVPRRGPLVVMANHPFGGLEGLVLAAMLARIRPDVRLLANQMLAAFPALKSVMLYVDPFGGDGAVRRNVHGMRRALDWLEEGGALGVFPAGEVSHLTVRGGDVADPAWSPTIARIALRARATVVPVRFAGRNGAAFQLLGLVHPRLRTLLLPHEFLNKRDREILVTVGGAIGPDRLDRLGTPERATSYLRARTEVLQGRLPSAPAIAAPARALAPVEPAGDGDALQREHEGLDPATLLLATRRHEVRLVRAAEAPRHLREIGRLREIAFREVGEGTGRPTDLDRFDAWYRHMFVWDREAHEIVGAYRLGFTAEILAERGPAGLYTRTLFHFRRRVLEQIDPAIELGRSFVRRDRQRSTQALMLLWKGIGRVILSTPGCHRLFGPVSISNDYRSLSKRLLVQFLRATRLRGDLGDGVRPRRPVRMRPIRALETPAASAVVGSLDEVDDLVAEIESDLRGMPVLLRQYLRLNARLLGFNVDPDFGDAIDGLLLIDLRDVDPRVLAFYLGDAEAEALRTRMAAEA